MSGIRSVHAFFIVAMKRSLWKLFRHEQAEARQVAAFLHGDPPPTSHGLLQGRLPRTQCRRGHLFTPETTVYIGPRRTCRICRNARAAVRGRAARAAVSGRVLEMVAVP